MIKKMLIANRGEIALRIIRTCREIGIRTVAVFSEADQNAGYVAAADEAYPIGPPPPQQSYLKIDTLIQTAKNCRADAIHPGYGFLSENADFAWACERAKIIFIGPSGKAIQTVGNKINARRLAQKLGVPVLPGLLTHGRPVLRRPLKKIGYPLLIKAAAGGGGKGMRVVRSWKDFPQAYRESSSEAKQSFGDPTTFIERYLDKPRHIEIQILADTHGNVIHLGERECSIQRRHQKLVEESPSPFVDDDLRRRMGEAAKKLMRAAGYVNAGTVEFLVDAKRNFYFMEVNTRLQVEHPVTEMVIGLDLVRQQIEIAQGEKLRMKQEDVTIHGHAMECRIYAEDFSSQFAPSVGTIMDVRFPQGPHVRVDADIRAGSEITVYYDPMIGKLITWGRNREETLSRMVRALQECLLIGIQTTIPFHIHLLRHASFRQGKLHTRFIETDFKPISSVFSRAPEAAALAAALQMERIRKTSLPGQTFNPLSPWQTSLRKVDACIAPIDEDL